MCSGSFTDIPISVCPTSGCRYARDGGVGKCFVAHRYICGCCVRKVKTVSYFCTVESNYENRQMLILLSCAKTMSGSTKGTFPPVTVPRFRREASEVALQMSQFSVEELERLLHVSPKIALENYRRYQAFHEDTSAELPALLAYTGIVFKRLRATDFSLDDFSYAQHHLRMTSFCYGLLRPLDTIRPYRLEGDVLLPEAGTSVFAFWRSRLTDTLIEDVRRAGGVLCNLASEEMKNLFDWKRVEAEVDVVTPEFHVWKRGKPATVVVYTKMLRGEMSRFILKNRIENPEDLHCFAWEGFEYDASLSGGKRLFFINGKE